MTKKTFNKHALSKKKLSNQKHLGNFDGIANKFDENIYGTSKGKLRHQLLLAHLHSTFDRSSSDSAKPMQVLDVGGGTGMMALAFSELGHNVCIVDTSNDALEIARKRLKNYPQTRFIQQDAMQINEEFDFIICHALLEWLPNPKEVIEHLCSLLRPTAKLSLSFFNQDAKVFNNLLYGNFKYVLDGLPPKNTVRLNPHNAQKPADIIEFVDTIPNLVIKSSQGIRCIHDYMLDKSKIESNYETLIELEIEYGRQEPFKWFGKYFHLIAQKTFA